MGTHGVFPNTSARPDSPEEEENRNWFVAQLKPAGFTRARRNLARQGFRTFMPIQTVTRRRAGRLQTGERPLFPGYIFVEIPPSGSRWRSINGTSGVSKLVTFGGQKPVEVPSTVMRALRANPTFAERSDLSPGDRVRLIAGPFATALARVEDLSDAERIVVLFDMMGRHVRARMSSTDLEKI